MTNGEGSAILKYRDSDFVLLNYGITYIIFTLNKLFFMMLHNQGSHRLEKALNLKGCLEKALNFE